MNKIANYLGLARKAGFLQVGEEATGFTARSGKARLILVASDASDNASRRAAGFLQTAGCFLLNLPLTKQELSAALGKNGCSMMAVTDSGFAYKLAQEIYGAAPDEETGKIRDSLKAKHDKILRRRREANNKNATKKVHVISKKQ